MADPLVLLAERLLLVLKQQPQQTASELAQKLAADRREVNQCLVQLRVSGKVQQDQAYRWRLIEHKTALRAEQLPAIKTATPEHSRLCRYYLECIGQDSDEGVSVFAASRAGETEYVELPALPMPGSDWDWWNTTGATRILNKVRADKTNLVAWLGYPIRLRKHRTPKWEGFFAEPVLLWPIALPEGRDTHYQILDELPTLNFAFLRTLAMGDPAHVIEEAARLASELGLNNPLEDQPEIDELLYRLEQIRPDWDWKQSLNLENCCGEHPLSTLTEAGIYNRAVVLPGKRSPYTQGLETELKQMSEASESQVASTAVGKWLSGYFPLNPADDSLPLLEVLPMNSEQRAAVRSALTQAHTVVTGPPGTGKSQVVTNLLVNAAWRGMKVLFASKNNKAVDVVESRVNSLGNRPALLRLGSKEYQAKLSSYLTAMLSGTVSAEDEHNYQEGLKQHQQLTAKLTQLDQIQQATLATRNRVDCLEADVGDYRTLFGAKRFNALDGGLLAQGEIAAPHYLQSVDALDPSGKGLIARLGIFIFRRSRLKQLALRMMQLESPARHVGVSLPPSSNQPDFQISRAAARSVLERCAAAQKVLAYQDALEELLRAQSFESIALQRQELTQQLAQSSSKLWRDWVQMAPARLTAKQRRDVADYAALLQLMTGPDARNVSPVIRSRARALQQQVTAMFSCWAVTSLSARGRVPFEPAYFDLVVIDEASQCDIASALPLLYRAKRTVIIGDPMQLRHISAVTRQKEGELQQKYGHVETRAAWMYSVNSLYDLAAGVAAGGNIINLRDHHRSHADIISFSNHAFYENKLRVATRHQNLNSPRHGQRGVVWQDVKGKTVRPLSGGAQNRVEATALVAALRDLLIIRGYEGSVGVVTPFRAQAQLIQQMVAEHAELANMGSRWDLLIDTVHRFQGDERDVMFFSPVISKDAPPGALSFLRSNGNLFNVAITRARALLYVVGDRNAAATCDVGYLADFSDYVASLARKDSLPEKREQFTQDETYPTVARPEQVSEWERLFYKALHQAGLRPIPQYSVENYDLDFALFIGDQRLNIEVDGERYHRSWTGELCLRDQLRNQRLIELGWDVQRFWVYELRDRLPQSIKRVVDWVSAAQFSSKSSSSNKLGY